jgi:hypothetical protein
MFEFYLSTANWVPYGSLAVFQIQLAHQQTAVPLTRDYITSSERGLVGSNNKYRQARSGAPPSNTARKNQKNWFSGGYLIPYLKTLSEECDAPAAVEVSPDQS